MSERPSAAGPPERGAVPVLSLGRGRRAFGREALAGAGASMHEVVS